MRYFYYSEEQDRMLNQDKHPALLRDPTDLNGFNSNVYNTAEKKWYRFTEQNRSGTPNKNYPDAKLVAVLEEDQRGSEYLRHYTNSDDAAENLKCENAK